MGVVVKNHKLIGKSWGILFREHFSSEYDSEKYKSHILIDCLFDKREHDREESHIQR